MTIQIRRAQKSRRKLRMAIVAPSGAGKTFTALAIAHGLTTDPSKVIVIDTEHGSASLYADQRQFDVIELDSYSPARYVEAIKAATDAGYEVVIIDSLSHAWIGKDGALEMVDRAAAKSKTNNSFGAWREVTPEHNRLVEAIISAPAHIICTMRAKQEYVQEKDEKTGRTTIRKVGLAPVQRDGLEYEFDIVADMDTDHRMVVTKSRIPMLADSVTTKPNESFGQMCKDWLDNGTDPSIIKIEKPPFDLATLAQPQRIKANSNQLQEIKKLAAKANVGADYFDRVKSRYSVTSSAELTTSEAAAVIVELETMLGGSR